MAAAGGLGRRLARAFLLQAALISSVALVGVYAASVIIEEVLVKQALLEEAEFFWSAYAGDPAFPNPATRNLTGYLQAGDRTPVPEELAALAPGFHRLRSRVDFSLVHVSERDARRLFLVFDGERVNELATLFGLLPLSGVLIVLYLAAWLSYVAARRAYSPVIWLAREVSGLDPRQPDPALFADDRIPPAADAEVLSLARAIREFAERLNAFVQREQSFTRDASHELRSPLTVIKIAADLLLSEQDLAAPAQRSVERIKRSVQDMEELTDALLLLARETETDTAGDWVCINDVVSEELERIRYTLGDKPVQVQREAQCRLLVQGSDKVLSVLVGNLLRNAFDYTDAGSVAVRIGVDGLRIEDSGIGMDAEALRQVFEPYYRACGHRRGGHGVGLTIVKRFSDRFGWPVEFASQPGRGTQVSVRFPQARSEPLAGGH